jgi:hypothetical protein
MPAFVPSSLRQRLTALLTGLLVLAVGGGIYLTQSPTADVPRLDPSVVQGTPGQPAFGDLVAAFNRISDSFLKFVGIAALLAFLAGAYSYFLSGGNEDAINKARTQMVGSVIALFIVVAASGIVSIFTNFFKTPGSPL